MEQLAKHTDLFLNIYKARVDFTNYYRPNCKFKDYIYHTDKQRALEWIEAVKRNNPNICNFQITLYQ